MIRRTIAAAGTALALAALAACGSSGGGSSSRAAPSKDRSGDLTVWLMVDAQTSWPELVKQADAEFRAKYPKVHVHVQYQQWNNKVQKLDTALSGSGAPDVVELGNTETMTYILNGALAPVDPKQYENSGTWIKGLKDTCTKDGKLYCVPYYAGARVGIYNADMYKQAGVTAPPANETQLLADLDKVKAKHANDTAFSPLYMPGRYWYAAMSYVRAYGGTIAKQQGGRWQGTLEAPAAVKGIRHWADLVKKYYRGDPTKDEADEAAVMAKQKAATMYGNGWEAGVVTDPKAGNPKLKKAVRTFAFPGPNGKPLPSFIGGSDLGITAKSKNQDLAAAWIKEYTSAKSQEVLIKKKTLPNNTAQLAELKHDPVAGPAAQAVESSWFTPIAPGWAQIEKKQILQLMLVDIVTGKKSVPAAAKSADAQIDALING